MKHGGFLKILTRDIKAQAFVVNKIAVVLEMLHIWNKIDHTLFVLTRDRIRGTPQDHTNSLG